MKLQPYTSYKSLDIEWNQSAPSHWRSSRLKFDSYIKARVGWHGLKSDEFTEEGPYLITGSDFSGKVIDWSKCYHCEVERYEQDPYIQLKDDDLLITKDGTIGKVILTGKLLDKATLNSGVFVLRPLKERYDTKYYYWLMQSSVFHGFVEYYRTGSTIAHLYQETFCNLPYAIPPLDEQAQIATFLDRETAKIDRLIEKQQRLIELLEEKRQAVISHAVTKGLNSNTPMKDSGIEWLGEVPKHWDVCFVKHKCQDITDGAHISPVLENGKHPFISIRDIKNGHIDFENCLLTSDENYQYLVKTGCQPMPGDVLFSKDGTIGETAITPSSPDFVVASSLIILKPDSKSILPTFLNFALQSRSVQEQVESFVKGAALRRLSIQNLKKIIGAFPTINEQQVIVCFIEEKLEKLNQIQSRAKLMITLLNERRRALISATVTGKIDVRDQVPQDVEEAVAS